METNSTIVQITDKADIYNRLHCDCTKNDITEKGCSCGRYQFKDIGYKIIVVDDVAKLSRTLMAKSTEFANENFATYNDINYCSSCVDKINDLSLSAWMEVKIKPLDQVVFCGVCCKYIGQITLDAVIEELEEFAVVEQLALLIWSEFAKLSSKEFAIDILSALTGNDYSYYPTLGALAKRVGSRVGR